MKRKQTGMLSIGALSAATGVPVETLRSWERRYGFPVAERKPSGHRVYPLAVVPRLQLVAKALAQGHRAAEVVSSSETALESLLAALPAPGRVRNALARQAASISTDSSDILDAIRAFRADELQRRFHADWTRLGSLGFVEQRAAPLLSVVGEAWATGALDVRHEHFASACLGDFLRTARLPLDDRATGPVVALATLPDELHGMGLQMSAVIFAAAGWRVLMLGTDTPVAQLASVARETSLAAVAVSCALPRRRRTPEQLRVLRRSLSRSIAILVGGSGAPAHAPVAGIEIFKDFSALDLWLHERAA